MKKYASMEEYTKFSEYLLNERAYLDPQLSFRKLCRSLGLRASQIERRLYSETGFHGQELMEIFRSGDVKMLLLLHI